MKKIIGIFILLLLSEPALTQTLEPIIFVSKTEATSEELVSSHVVKEADEIEKQNYVRSTDLLKQVPGVEVSQTGLSGGEASVFIRGSEARHTLILVDGVKIYDPTSIGRTLNLATLNTLDIEKIEVLKGAQSVLYGSDAIGGVINIITKKAKNKKTLKVSTGYFNELSMESSFLKGESLFYLSGYYQDAKHLSEAKAGDEKDQSITKGMTLNHSIEFGEIELESTLKLSNTFAEVDGYDFATYQVVDDEHANSLDQQIIVKEKLIHPKFQLDVSYNRYQRQNKALNGASYKTYHYDGSVLEAEGRFQKKSDTGTWLLGLNSTKEIYRDDDISEKQLSLFDVFTLKSNTFGKNTFELGVRGTYNQEFGAHGVYQLGMKRKINPHHKLSVSTKSGFKAPSVYQQQAPASNSGPVGNKDLAPEKSESLELGHEYQRGTITFGTSFFYNEVDNFIEFKNSKGYQNLSSAIYKGVELSLIQSGTRHTLSSNLTLINYATSTGEEITRRPNFSWQILFDYKLTDHHNINVDWQWKGRRFETVGSDDTEIMQAYDVLDLNYNYKPSAASSFHWLASLKNIFDRDYEVVKGYSVLRRAAEVSLVYSF